MPPGEPRPYVSEACDRPIRVDRPCRRVVVFFPFYHVRETPRALRREAQQIAIGTHEALPTRMASWVSSSRVRFEFSAARKTGRIAFSRLALRGMTAVSSLAILRARPRFRNIRRASFPRRWRSRRVFAPHRRSCVPLLLWYLVAPILRLATYIRPFWMTLVARPPPPLVSHLRWNLCLFRGAHAPICLLPLNHLIAARQEPHLHLFDATCFSA